MAVYLVTYDLKGPEKDYDGLIKAIKTYHWCKPMKSTFLVKTTDTSANIRDKLKKHLDSDDVLLVIEHTGGWASYRLPKTAKWLKENL